jgi:hypothetical protein
MRKVFRFYPKLLNLTIKKLLTIISALPTTLVFV